MERDLKSLRETECDRHREIHNGLICSLAVRRGWIEFHDFLSNRSAWVLRCREPHSHHESFAHARNTDWSTGILATSCSVFGWVCSINARDSLCKAPAWPRLLECLTSVRID